MVCQAVMQHVQPDTGRSSTHKVALQQAPAALQHQPRRMTTRYSIKPELDQ